MRNSGHLDEHIDAINNVQYGLDAALTDVSNPKLVKMVDRAKHMLEMTSELLSTIDREMQSAQQVKRNIARDEEASANYLYSAEDFLDKIEDYGAPDEVDAESLMSALEEDGFLNAGDQDSVIAAEAAIEEYLYQ